MKLPIYFSIIILFCISFTSAELILSQNPLPVSVVVNHQQNFSITLNNTYNFQLSNILFSDLSSKGFIFQSNMSIPANSIRTFDFSVNTNSSFHGAIQSKVQFTYAVDLPETVTTYDIGISSNGFSSNYITIRNGDSIKFSNSDYFSHSIYSSAFSTLNIATNSSETHLFNQIGIFNFYDTQYGTYITNFNGNIQVVNRTMQQQAHNPNYDTTLNVNLDSSLNPTELGISNSKSDYQIGNGEFSKGLITINNAGNTKAEGVKISSDSTWITFDRNNFEINNGQSDWVTYTITPLLIKTEETNKTYNFSINVGSYNSPSKNFSISIFIPYYEISSGLTSDIGTLTYLNNVYCPLYPCSFFCHPELPQCNSNLSGSGMSGNITANITSIDLYNLLRQNSQMTDTITRLQNQLQQFIEKYGVLIDKNSKDLNESLTVQKSNSEIQSTTINSLWILGFFVLLTVSIIVVALRMKKIKSKKDITGETYRHKED